MLALSLRTSFLLILMILVSAPNATYADVWLNPDTARLRTMTVRDLNQIARDPDVQEQERILTYYMLANLLKESSPRAAWQYYGLASSIDTTMRNSLSMKMLEAELLVANEEYFAAAGTLQDLVSRSSLGKRRTRKVLGLLFLSLAKSGQFDEIRHLVDNWSFEGVSLSSLDGDSLRNAYLATVRRDWKKGVELLEYLASRHYYSDIGKSAFNELMSLNCARDNLPKILLSLQFLDDLSQYAQLGNGIQEFLQLALAGRLRTKTGVRYLSQVEKFEHLLDWRLYDLAHNLRLTLNPRNLQLNEQEQFWYLSYKLYSRTNQFRLATEALNELAALGKDVRYRYALLLRSQGQHQSAYRIFARMSGNGPRFKFASFWQLFRANKFNSARAILNKCDANRDRHRCWRKGEEVAAMFWSGHSFYKEGNFQAAFSLFKKILNDESDSYYSAVIQTLYRSDLPKILNVPSPYGSMSSRVAFGGDLDASGLVGLFKSHLASQPLARIHKLNIFPEVSEVFRDLVAPKFERRYLKRMSYVAQKLGDYRSSRRAYRFAGGDGGRFASFRSYAQSFAGNREHWENYYPKVFKEIVEEQSRKEKVDEFLLYSVMRAESAYDPLARSAVGAKGILQIMPYTALKIAKEFGIQSFEYEKLESPAHNIPLATRYLKKLISYYSNNFMVALAAYNAGPTTVNDWLARCGDCSTLEFVDSIPFRETRRYVKRIMRYYNNYSLLYGGKPIAITDLPRPGLGGIVY